MLRTLIIAVAAMATSLIVSGTAISQTADGIPPAREGICDQLQGGTPGLYGLCVAYCEAQDLDEMFQEIKAGGNPGEKILANYRRKMRTGDSDMPCIVSAPAACPCFNTVTCNSGDFLCELQLGEVADLFAGQTCNTTQTCQNTGGANPTAFDACNTFGDTLESRTVQVGVPAEGTSVGACIARSQVFGVGGVTIQNSTGFVLDRETALTCLDEINAYDGNGPDDGNLDGNAGQMCMLAN